MKKLKFKLREGNYIRNYGKRILLFIHKDLIIAKFCP